MKTVHILYTCDAWHSYSSMELVGVFSSRKILNDRLQKLVRQKEISQEDYDNLQRIDQTQGGQTNYHIDERPLDPLKVEQP